MFKLLTCLFLIASGLPAAGDPFLGKWVWNSKKSPKPKITYSVKDVGGNRFALTGSTGETTTIKADGVLMESPHGGTVSFKKIDDRKWRMIRNNPLKLLRTFTVSPDDKTLEINDIFTHENGKEDKSTVKYARIDSGKGIVGAWQSVSMEDQLSDTPSELNIEMFGKDGLTFAAAAYKYRLDMKFDGKSYYDQGPEVPKGTSTSGKRLDAHTIHVNAQVNGNVEETREYKVSADGKTLTMVFKPVKSNAVFISIFDRGNP